MEGHSGRGTRQYDHVHLRRKDPFNTITRYADIAGTNQAARTTYSYDQTDRLTSLTHAHDMTTLAEYAWSFDAQGRVVGFTTPDDDATYTYEYDAEGNRTARVQILVGPFAGERTEYGYDHRNRLTTATITNALGVALRQVRYTYDALDQRIGTEIDSGGDGTYDEVERYTLDTDHVALVFNEAGDVTRRYLYGPNVDQVLAEETLVSTILPLLGTVSVTSTVQWFLADHQGSIRDVVNSDGANLAHVVYDSFGRIVGGTSGTFELRFGYTGRELATESGDNVYFYRRRFYDAGVGRFLSQDPIGFEAGDTNLYRYVRNDPLNRTDPSGLVSVAIYDANDNSHMRGERKAGGPDFTKKAKRYDYAIPASSPADAAQKLRELYKRLRNEGKTIDELIFIDHGFPGGQDMGTEPLVANDTWRDICRSVAPGGIITLYGCEVGKGFTGIQYLKALAGVGGVTVQAGTGDNEYLQFRLSPHSGRTYQQGDWVTVAPGGNVDVSHNLINPIHKVFQQLGRALTRPNLFTPYIWPGFRPR